MLADQTRLAAPHLPKAAPRACRAAHDHQGGGIGEAVFQDSEPEHWAGRAARSSVDEKRAV